MKILHTSDLHGTILDVIKKADNDFDLWIDSGDFLPDHPLYMHMKVPAHLIAEHQIKWLLQRLQKIRKWLNGRPMLFVRGNHDYIDISRYFKPQHKITEGVEIDGVKFCGFSEIPFIGGFFWNETYNEGFSKPIEKVLKYNPHVLVTHAPPYSILDQLSVGQSVGIVPLAQALFSKEHNIRHHLFGHIHCAKGIYPVEHPPSLEMIKFYNSACTFRKICI